MTLACPKGGILFPKGIPPFAPCLLHDAEKILYSLDKSKKSNFLKNPLDKWAPRAIMQPTSEELQTYDGEK